MPVQDPEITYQARIDTQQLEADRWGQQDDLLANLRFVLFVLIILTGSLALYTKAFHITWTLAPTFLFIITIVRHATVLRNFKNANDTIEFYKIGLERIRDQWMGKGDTGETWAPEDHPYAHDLDLFGQSSLFQLLNTTRTKLGASALANWLTNPSDIDTIEQRHEAIAELRDQLDLREHIALSANEIQSRLHPIRLTRWAQEPAQNLTSLQVWLPRILTTVTLSTIVLFFIIPLAYAYIPFMTSFIINMIALKHYGKQALHTTQQLDGALQDLQLITHLANTFEQQTFQSQLFVNHQQNLIVGNQGASISVKKLTAIFTWMELHRNPMFIPVSIILLWIIHLAHLIENWRTQHQQDIPKWLHSIGEIEALCALATYTYEHPADPFPEFINEAQPTLNAIQLKHPLLPASTSIPNPIKLDDSQSLLIVSGSNMSGKSTYLRTIGINTLLAMIGAPIRGKSMQLTPINIGASLHIQDSIQTGTSHFYAEILRIKTIVKLTEKERPLLFLIDEILHGTNSHDRRIGTQGIVNQLLDQNTIGLITTHDLALTHLDGPHQEKINNVHFQDQIEGNQLAFDYKAHPGIVQKSNALALMRSIGLHIQEPQG